MQIKDSETLTLDMAVRNRTDKIVKEVGLRDARLEVRRAET
jgi:hypothetical protein